MTLRRPDPEATLATLKPFQRATVNHVFDSLWGKGQSSGRFLVADEVGLGKTMVAKGVAARAIDHLWDRTGPTTIVYICSNGQIAKQNLRKLRSLTGGEAQENADRLTMLPAVIGKETGEKVRLVSFTPGTSFDLGQSTGQVQERALLFKMLTHPAVLGEQGVKKEHGIEYLSVSAKYGNLEWRIWRFRDLELDPGVMERFAKWGHANGVFAKFQEDVRAWNQKPEHGREARRRRDHIIGQLRILMAESAVEELAPDLVIMDEFQRFKDIFPTEEEQKHSSRAQQLASRVIEKGTSKVLILSATPYKMYTLPDEPEGEDHYQDFTRTISFLAGQKKAEHIATQFRTMRKAILTKTPQARDEAIAAKSEAEQELRKVMSRTERLSATPERDGMLGTKQLGQIRLDPSEVRAWRAYDELSRHVGGGNTFEYWRSVPYAPNLMDRSSYQVQSKLMDALSEPNEQLAGIIEKHQDSLLRWQDIKHYQRVEPVNAKLRALFEDLESHHVDQLVWLPPSLEYLAPEGIYADEEAKAFTKRLVFSAWGAVPKVVSALTSYEVERRTRAEGDIRKYDDPRSANFVAFGWDTERNAPRNLPNLTLLNPSIALAELGDPLTIAREEGITMPIPRAQLLGIVADRIRERLPAAGVDMEGTARDTANAHWYGIAPYWLDRELLGDSGQFADRAGEWTRMDGKDGGDRATGRLRDTMKFAFNADDLGPAPSDLPQVLAEMAVGAPGICALRALTRAGGSIRDHRIRGAAFSIAEGFRGLYNHAEIAAIIRSQYAGKPYWRQLLNYGIDGNLQSVMDEYAHTLVESEGLQDTAPEDRSASLADVIAATVSTRAVNNTMLDVSAKDGQIQRFEEHRIRSHFAASFGRDQSQEASSLREATVRESFNSPFWPFLLVSTSVGQEGLDFHTYSHAVVHWNLPSNPVDLEQREGRVHRYKGHAVRKNVAAEFRSEVVTQPESEPWAAMFDAAEKSRPEGDDLINPYWVFSREGGAKIERYVPAMPLSKEGAQHQRLVRTVGAYRSVMGQPRQEELIKFIGEDSEWMRIDLSPPK